MKKILLSLFFLLTFTALMAQAPQRISYQSIIRDANKVVVASSPVGIKISLLQGTATGPAVYVETHRSTTNANGLVSLEIGTGTVLSGTFVGIDWSTGPYLIQTETDPTGGTNYSIPGIAALNSVPYALFSANGTPGPKGDTGAMGAAGTNGTNGLAGTAGTNGTNGLAGTAGATGPTGLQGAIGPQGPAGANGLSVSSADFVDVTTNQTVAGAKTFGSDITVNGVVVGLGPNAISSNTVLGNNALNVNVSGSDNTVMGKSALRSNTTGSYNTATGVNVLYSNTTGNFNTASGRDALFANLTGNYNTASGLGSLGGNTGGQFNTATGVDALFANTVGNYNTASGLYALISNVTGSNNTALGYNADVASGALTNATAIGNGAIVTTSNTIQLGADGTNGITAVTNVKTSGTITAGAVTYPKTHGAANQVLTTTGTGTLTWSTPSGGVPYTGATQAVDLGAFDLKVNGLTVGRGNGNKDSNTASGEGTLSSNTTGAYNTASGYGALYQNTTGDGNTASGYAALQSNTTGSSNIASGNYTLASNTTGAYNTATGLGALYSNTIGAANTATGYIALYNNTTGTDNTANGRGALYSNTTGAYNTATGLGALSSNTEGVYNTATGYVALASNTTGLGNQASGNYALTGNTTGNTNSASGYSALRANTTGSNNTASGYNALDANTTGSNNTAIGYYANVGSAALTNATAIGNGATVNASNTIQLGDAYVAKVITSGTLTAGTVTYPNAHNITAGQVLTTNVSGVASWTTPAVGGFTHYLGEAFNGGIIFYLYKGGDGLEHGLIVALTESTDKWQTTGTLVNANRTEDGAYNTNLMTGSPAKDYIASLGTGWYLPSIDELGLLYNNRYSAQKGLRTGGNTPLSTATYSSSTEYDANSAYVLSFSNDVVNTNGKTGPYTVRGVRAF